ncbi:putative hexose carrier protein [Dipodascopsis uninucleata]
MEESKVAAESTAVSERPAHNDSSGSPTFLKLKGQNLVYAVTFGSSIGFLLLGYDLGYMGGLTTSDEFLRLFDYPNASLLGFMVSAYELGCLFGSLFQFFFGDRKGRKFGILLGTSIIIIGAVLQTTSYGLAQFLVGRIVAGFGLGAMVTVVPVWLIECTIPKSRGRMMAMQLSNLILGLIISNWLDYGMASYSGSISWRFPCAFQIVFCLIILCYIPFLPESPRYLFAVGKIEQGTHCLAALRAGYPDHPEIDKEIQQIQYALAVESEDVGTWSDVWKDNGISGFSRVAIAMSANAIQQLCGSNVMSSLGPYILQNSIGLSHYNSLLVSGGLQVFYFLSSLIPWYTIDIFGRRKLFMIGSVGMGICMTMSAILVGIGSKSCAYGAVVFLYLYQTCFTLGWQSNLWAYPSELLPMKLRLRGGSLAVTSQWVFTFLVVEVTPPMIENIGYKSYIIFAILNFLAVPTVYYFYPETSKRRLEVVDLFFGDRDGKRPSIFRVVKDSVNPQFVQEIERQLEELVQQQHENREILAEEKLKSQHLEAV